MVVARYGRPNRWVVGPGWFHRMIRERALVAKIRVLRRDKQERQIRRTLHVSLDRAEAVIDGMTEDDRKRETAKARRGILGPRGRGPRDGTGLKPTPLQGPAMRRRRRRTSAPLPRSHNRGTGA